MYHKQLTDESQNHLALDVEQQTCDHLTANLEQAVIPLSVYTKQIDCYRLRADPKKTDAQTNHWAALPGVILVTICSHLYRDADRISFSLVCRHWHAAFVQPSLWSNRSFIVDGSLAKMQRMEILGRYFGYGLKHIKVLKKASCIRASKFSKR